MQCNLRQRKDSINIGNKNDSKIERFSFHENNFTPFKGKQEISKSIIIFLLLIIHFPRELHASKCRL